MGNRKYIYGIFCMIILLWIIVFFGMFLTAKEDTEQLQALVGSVYQKDPELADDILRYVFSGTDDVKSMEMGKQAAFDMGYTEKAYDFYFDQRYPGVGQILCVILSAVCGLAAAALAVNQYTSGKKRVIWLCNKIQDSRDGNAIFDAPEHAEWEWNELEYGIAKVIDDNMKQDRYFHQRQKQMELFIENIAHQIKTPLAGILLNLELLEGRAADTKGDKTRRDEKRLILDSIGQGEKIKKLLARLLNLARMEAGKIHFVKEPVELPELLEEVCGEFSGQKVDVELVQDPESGLSKGCMIQGDRAWLYEAIYNLVENAVRHAETTEPVEIRMLELYEEVKIEVCDRGKGLPQEVVKHLFDRYYTAHTSDAFSTGIGLNLVLYVVQGHHGTVYAESSLGTGTRIELRLPKIILKEKAV